MRLKLVFTIEKTRNETLNHGGMKNMEKET